MSNFLFFHRYPFFAIRSEFLRAFSAYRAASFFFIWVRIFYRIMEYFPANHYVTLLTSIISGPSFCEETKNPHTRMRFHFIIAAKLFSTLNSITEFWMLDIASCGIRPQLFLFHLVIWYHRVIGHECFGFSVSFGDAPPPPNQIIQYLNIVACISMPSKEYLFM